LAALRDQVEEATAVLTGRARVLVVGCDHGVSISALGVDGAAAVALPCVANLPPSFIDYVLSRDLADGVLLTGCGDGACMHRFGIAYTEQRLQGARDPRLRTRVPRERVRTAWLGAGRQGRLAGEITAFQTDLATLPDASSPATRRQADSDRNPVEA
jgi:coenzyme F420-reducing hydrogenase delta subunit